jgi:hypothetical protein
MGPLIDKIIEEETHIKQDKNVPLFFFKKRAAITTYYVNDMYVNAEPVLFNALNSIGIPAPRNVTLSSKVDFFGEPKDDLMALLDLVVKIDDPNNGLLYLNQETKKIVHTANEQYKHVHHIDMYDINKSEKHSYLPHLSLGHLRVNYITHLVNDASNADKVVERIKQRILQAAMQILSESPLEIRKISFDKLSVYDQQKRMYIKEYNLGS